jgi:hypothetical protein
VKTGHRFTLVLDELDDAAPWPVRLRAVLKFALRSCRFRCVSIKELPGVPGQTPRQVQELAHQVPADCHPDDTLSTPPSPPATMTT